MILLYKSTDNGDASPVDVVVPAGEQRVVLVGQQADGAEAGGGHRVGAAQGHVGLCHSYLQTAPVLLTHKLARDHLLHLGDLSNTSTKQNNV